jgi:hypothetical protein
VRVDGSIASLKVAVTVEAMATPVVALVGVTAVTVGTGPCAVVNDHELTLAMAFPVAPTTPVVTAAVYVLLAASGAFGVSVAVKVVALYLTVALTGAPPCGVSVKVEAVMVDAFNASLKVAVMVVFAARPVLPLPGVTAVTVGAGPVAVVKDQVSLAASAVPAGFCTPVVIEAV